MTKMFSSYTVQCGSHSAATLDSVEMRYKNFFKTVLISHVIIVYIQNYEGKLLKLIKNKFINVAGYKINIQKNNIIPKSQTAWLGNFNLKSYHLKWQLKKKKTPEFMEMEKGLVVTCSGEWKGNQNELRGSKGKNFQL